MSQNIIPDPSAVLLHKCMRFLALNQVWGDYLQLGMPAGQARWMGLVHKMQKALDKGEDHGLVCDRYVGIGVTAPDPAAVTASLIDWGIRPEDLKLVPGPVNEACVSAVRDKLHPAASLVYITAQDGYELQWILEWLPPSLKEGTIVIFDKFHMLNDWCAFNVSKWIKAYTERCWGTDVVAVTPFDHDGVAQAFVVRRTS